MSDALDLLGPLRRYWGYDSFRPQQERIVRSILAGRDVAVVMPTGGGKSLCYQLPALVLGGTTVVISPLIALMQDQAAQLDQMGIPAAVLNSSIDSREQWRVMKETQAGRYRLLYLSPERLARADTVEWLGRAQLAMFAIDEAHCISEWGHEFRPEYRQLSALRRHFPDTPIAAFTASATQRVRHDILAQLQLRQPDKYIVSFHRPNLRYVMRECQSAKEQVALLVRALRSYEGSSVIVYAPTIASVEETVDLLAAKRILAVPYHGQMDNDVRQRNQERWTSDEVRVMVGTLAFGLGINKPAVRAVIHLALPKSVEQYYQEAGRAGRDGLPADCALLWRKKDLGLLAHFIGKVADGGERERAWQRYHEVRRFAEEDKCRHLSICRHFGETPKWAECGACDICSGVPEWMDGEVEVESPRKRKSKEAARTVVPQRRASAPPLPLHSPPALSTEQIELREYFREWRRETARRAGTPAFMVLTDATIDDLCRKRPRSAGQLIGVSGIGERKAAQYGAAIFAAIDEFERGARASAPENAGTTPAEETVRLLGEGKSLAEIARIRGRQLGTVVGLVADLVEKGRLPFDPSWVEADKRPAIEEACDRLGVQWLKPLRDALPESITAEEIRLVVARKRYLDNV